ncbi:hypothetical protein ACET3Z_007214 [Daucus carota]
MGSLVASLMFVGGMIHQYSPYFRHLLKRCIKKIDSGCYPYIEITFNEHSSGQLSENCNAFVAIQHYLEANSLHTVKRLKADSITRGQILVLSMDDNEEITDEYHGIKLWWSSKTKEVPISRSHHKQRCYTLVFHSRYRDLIINSYMQHVIAEGKAIALRNRQRKLYTNKRQTPSPARWISAVFEHPATFETLALKPDTKKDIMDDLITFSKAKDYYMKIGKAWKRGYLLYGPPGTGKSTMIAAMANYLGIKSHELFGRVEKLLGETNTSPADVAENLMPTSADDDGETCLKCLISVLEDVKEAAMSRAKDETNGRFPSFLLSNL